MNMRFNQELLGDLIIQGYKYIIFTRDEDIITMTPAKKEIPREQLAHVNLGQLNLADLAQLEILQHINLLDEFIFIIDTKYFERVEARLSDLGISLCAN